MIRYQLNCRKGHSFEGWFANSEAFEKQSEDGQLACPHCGTRKVQKSLMAPNIAPSRSKRRKQQPVPQQEAPAAPSPEMKRLAAHKELAQVMRKLRAEIEAKSEYVGTRFSEEARKIHYEETPARGIHGEATADEAKSLLEEGIEFFPLPVLPEEQN